MTEMTARNENPGRLSRAGRERLESAIKQYKTGPLGLHDALVEGLAALDEGRAMESQHRCVLINHVGGWFALSLEVRDLLEALDCVIPAPARKFGALQRARLEGLAATSVPSGINAGGIGALRSALHALDQGVGLDAASCVQLQRWLDTKTYYGDGSDDDALRALLEILDARSASIAGVTSEEL